MLQTLDRGVNEQVSIPFYEKKETKVQGIAILGSHPQTVQKAPYHDKSWLIYACSPHNVEMRTLPRVDAWFENHLPIQDATRSYYYLRQLEKMTCPIYMRVTELPPDDFPMDDKHRAAIYQQHAIDKANISCFPTARLFPEIELKEKFCSFMFTSSIAYMLAKAIDDCEKNNYKKISIFGVMQASKTEFAYQRPGIQYFIWEATKRGIQVIAPEESKLFHIAQEQW